MKPLLKYLKAMKLQLEVVEKNETKFYMCGLSSGIWFVQMELHTKVGVLTYNC